MPSRKIAAWSLLLPVALAIVSLFVSAFVGFVNTDKVLTARVTAIETQQKNDKEALQRIESKVDRIYDKISGW